MLDADTKHRIDTCRNILVGKVPDPKSQVEQITIALIYKFMDDMDTQAIDLGGKRSFFINGFEKYAWSKLLAPTMGGADTLKLYSEAIGKMTENTHLPELFRDIFKNAYLPYRDPETLKSFLKEINYFSYDHSEKLGDAFEYLLSVLGSQGDAGQFRTPRHIIDFIVEVLKPQKNETVLDPACGTAGFLISAYKHIARNNTDAKGRTTLNPAERKRLATNFRGYDISPDMVRLSLVNLYLHGFSEPRVYEYDTLTSEDRWNEFADVILANPPFMSPKGGIKPHKRFSVQSKRSEVLFVDYMAEHLSPTGRAGIIVPEGIIFQSQGSYVELRKMLVDNSLVAVISLPAGVFNPYSGVKTSILILDKQLAKKASTIAFFKVENDGFGLGAQRRPIDQNDLPTVQAELYAYLEALRGGHDARFLSKGLIVSKEKIAENGDYNLSGERYLARVVVTSNYPFVSISEVACVKNGCAFKSEEYVDSGLRVIRIKNVQKGEVVDDDPKFMSQARIDEFCEYALKKGDILMSLTGNVGRVGRLKREHEPALLNQRVAHVQISDGALCLPEYLFGLLNTERFEEAAIAASSGIAQANLSSKWVGDYQIPLPPLEVQKEIVAEIEGYQKVINGARVVLDNYRPHIPIHSDWPMVQLDDVCEVKSGGTPSRSEDAYWNGSIPWVGSTVCKDGEVTSADEFITDEGFTSSAAKLFPKDTTLIALVGATIGKTGLLKFEATTNQNIAGLITKSREILDPVYLFHAAQKLYPEFMKLGEGKFRMANLSFVREQKIALPPIDTQKAIVAEIEAEQALVNANKELITRFEKKIQDTLARVWGEPESQ